MSAVQGDPVLAEFFAKHGIKPQQSRILSGDWLATAFNREKLKGSQRIADLSCYHKIATRNLDRVTCPRCAMLLKHGFDYERWLRGDSDAWPYDGMVWRDDPCRTFNERTDLEGNFVDDRVLAPV